MIISEGERERPAHTKKKPHTQKTNKQTNKTKQKNILSIL